MAVSKSCNLLLTAEFYWNNALIIIICHSKYIHTHTGIAHIPFSVLYTLLASDKQATHTHTHTHTHFFRFYRKAWAKKEVFIGDLN